MTLHLPFQFGCLITFSFLIYIARTSSTMQVVFIFARTKTIALTIFFLYSSYFSLLCSCGIFLPLNVIFKGLWLPKDLKVHFLSTILKVIYKHKLICYLKVIYKHELTFLLHYTLHFLCVDNIFHYNA